jgi:hypothetical protein
MARLELDNRGGAPADSSGTAVDGHTWVHDLSAVLLDEFSPSCSGSRRLREKPPGGARDGVRQHQFRVVDSVHADGLRTTAAAQRRRELWRETPVPRRARS